MKGRISFLSVVSAMLVSVFAGDIAIGAAVVYDGFDYPVVAEPDVTPVGGQDGGTGWNGVWNTSGFFNSPLKADGLNWGALNTVGARVEAPSNCGIFRQIDSSAANAGLLDDGATLWFSFIVDLDTNRAPQNILNLDFSFSLGTDGFLSGWGNDTNGNARYPRREHLLNNGEGIGVAQRWVWRDPGGGNVPTANFRTAYWQDEGANDNDAGDGPDGYGNQHVSEANDWEGITTGTQLLVGKVDWGVGGAGETISLYAPGTDFDTAGIGTPIQTLTTPDLNQSAFDTVAIHWKDTPGVDEIRLGGTMDDVLPTTACSPGDTDGDGDIDTGDLTTAITNFTGAGGSGKTCEDGDTDDDGDVDTGDLTFSITNFTGAQAGNAGVPDLVYDPATGNVTIDADGADVISFSLQSGPFNAADFSELPAGLTDNIASQIGWTSFNLFSGLTGTADLGAILPAGLDLAGLEAALTTASYGLALAGGGGGGRLDLIIPEPASMVLMGLGVVALARRRRGCIATA